MNPTSELHVEDQDIELASNGFKLRVSRLGASLRGFSLVLPDGSLRDVVTAYSGRENKVGGQGDVLIPFPGRIKAGRYAFQGVDYQLECNDGEGPNAIHGFLRSVPWSISNRGSGQITFTVDLDAASHPGYPFSLNAEVSYTIGDSGLTCAYRICNAGDSTTPVAAGFHPYFAVGNGPIDEWTLQLPFTGYLEFEDMIPTGRVLPVEGTEFDFRSSRRIGSTQLNNCFVDPIREEDNRVRIRLTGVDGRTAVIWADASLNYVVIYSGDPLPEPHRRMSLAIEPMTCASDGFNHPEWGVISLEPGAVAAGAWGASV